MATIKEATNHAEHLIEEKVEAVEKIYNDMIDTLRSEKDRMERDLRHEYRSAKRYVRAHPERSIGITFASGLLLGALLARILR